MDRDQAATLLVIEKLGLEPRIDTFNDRLLMQKSVYLAQALGVNLGYHFGWYLRGPYSPALTRDLFETLAGSPIDRHQLQKYTLDERSSRTLSKLRTLFQTQKKRIEADPDQTAFASWLERLASVHFVVKNEQVPGHEPSRISSMLRRAGKRYKTAEIDNALRVCRENGLL